MAWKMEVTSFGISVMTPAGMLDNNRLHISPQAAANADPAKFLEFTSEVVKVALKLREEQDVDGTD